MSTSGQAVGGIVGAVVGFFTPIGPLYSAKSPMVAGNIIDPPDTFGPVPLVNEPTQDHGDES